MKTCFIKYLPFLMLVFALVLNSCSSDENMEQEISVEDAISKFNDSFQKSSYELISLKDHNIYTPSLLQNSYNAPLNSPESASNSFTTIEAQEILLPMSRPTNQFMLDIGFSQQEIDYLFDTEEEKASVGLLFQNILQEYNSQNPFVSYDDSKAIDCLLEATGVSAALGAIGLLAGQALTKTVIKKAIKQLASTVGKRALGAIGLAIIVGEFVWCMNRS